MVSSNSLYFDFNCLPPSFLIAHNLVYRPFGFCAEFLAERVYNEYLIPVVVSSALCVHCMQLSSATSSV